jgi:hypothetical protein
MAPPFGPPSSLARIMPVQSLQCNHKKGASGSLRRRRRERGQWPRPRGPGPWPRPLGRRRIGYYCSYPGFLWRQGLTQATSCRTKAPRPRSPAWRKSADEDGFRKVLLLGDRTFKESTSTAGRRWYSLPVRLRRHAEPESTCRGFAAGAASVLCPSTATATPGHAQQRRDPNK